MKDSSCYIVCWLLNGHKVYLLWGDGGKKADYYSYRILNGVIRLFVTCDIQEAICYAETNDLELYSKDEVSQELDFDKLLKILKNLLPEKSISERKARLLLEAWNAFDDASHSINRPIFPVGKYTKEDIDKLYEKLFFGNNLPSMTPENKKYSPILSKTEIECLRSIFNFAVKEIANEISFSGISEIYGKY